MLGFPNCTSDGLASFTFVLSHQMLLIELPHQTDVVADNIDTRVRVGHASVGMVGEVPACGDSNFLIKLPAYTQLRKPIER